ncbi:Aste57867_15567 [Aphanomyces stellatus]|uniref:Aste57867_15567 protein n=1 Tax=Aphanomyces stellatus TaxID=120398 RepID=A0A485L4F3_9STRA|nr:hypothetical protein As57867_015511 [Aphanomyces stellatus]VFT92369.1 Aste57867_15567 [Aphanomyces stellatus]
MKSQSTKTQLTKSPSLTKTPSLTRNRSLRSTAMPEHTVASPTTTSPAAPATPKAAPAPPPSRPMPPHRMHTLSKVKGVEYLQEGRQAIPPMTLHGRIVTNVDPKSRERAQKRWDALRDVVSRTPELTRITQKLQESIRVLKMKPGERKDTDVAHLYSWLMSQDNLSPLFQTMPEKMGKNICRELEFLHLRSNDVVVHQGDVGCTCFILISGLVMVFVRNPDEQEKFARLSLRRLYPPDPSVGLYGDPKPETDHVLQKTGSQVLRTAAANFGAKVATLKPGATFGEICLIEPDSKRTATVVVDSACSSANFIVLSSSSYTKMTSSQKTEGTISDHIAFLHQLYIFRSWSKMQLMRLASSMRYMVFSPQQYMQRKNAEIEYFYMILSGEAREVTSIIFNQQINNTSTHGQGPRKKHTEHKVTAELTFIGKYDVACEGLVSNKKHHLSSVDVRAETTVCCLALSVRRSRVRSVGSQVVVCSKKKLFQLSITNAAALHQKHVAHTIRVLEQVSDARQKWREARVNQATAYPDLLIKITSKMMRLSGNLCMQCGRCTHISGDSVCLFDAFLRAHDAGKPTERQYVYHKPTIAAPPAAADDDKEADASPPPEAVAEPSTNHEDAKDQPPMRSQALAEVWSRAAKHGLTPRRPATTTDPLLSQRRTKSPPDIAAEIDAVRASWPYKAFAD